MSEFVIPKKNSVSPSFSLVVSPIVLEPSSCTSKAKLGATWAGETKKKSSSGVPGLPQVSATVDSAKNSIRTTDRPAKFSHTIVKTGQTDRQMFSGIWDYIGEKYENQERKENPSGHR